MVARVETTGDTGELVTGGAVTVHSTREQTAAYYDQLISYVDGKVTLAFGRFSNPPTLDNVKTLTLDKDEIDAIRSCKHRDCDLQISGEGLQQIRRDIDWKSPDAPAYITRSVRPRDWLNSGAASPSVTSSKNSFCSPIQLTHSRH